MLFLVRLLDIVGKIHWPCLLQARRYKPAVRLLSVG